MTDVVHVASGDRITVPLVIGWEATREVPTVVHRVIGSGVPDFTFVAAGPHTGTYHFLNLDGTSATDLLAFLCRPGAFAVSGAPSALAEHSFYITGTLTLTLDDDTSREVIVSADWTEVAL